MAQDAGGLVGGHAQEVGGLLHDLTLAVAQVVVPVDLEYGLDREWGA